MLFVLLVLLVQLYSLQTRCVDQMQPSLWPLGTTSREAFAYRLQAGRMVRLEGHLEVVLKALLEGLLLVDPA